MESCQSYEAKFMAKKTRTKKKVKKNIANGVVHIQSTPLLRRNWPPKTPPRRQRNTV
jgi:hypothetical protein